RFAALGLVPVHPLVGDAHQLLEADAVLRERRPAGTRADLNRLSRGGRDLELLEPLLGPQNRRLDHLAARFGQEDYEFVTGPSADGVSRAEVVAQTARDLLQDLVPHVMAQSVAD